MKQIIELMVEYMKVTYPITRIRINKNRHTIKSKTNFERVIKKMDKNSSKLWHPNPCYYSCCILSVSHNNDKEKALHIITTELIYIFHLPKEDVIESVKKYLNIP
jgi:hypothetical protein